MYSLATYQKCAGMKKYFILFINIEREAFLFQLVDFTNKSNKTIKAGI